jgi:hypothetical protein
MAPIGLSMWIAYPERLRLLLEDDEPDTPFFDIPRASIASVKLTPPAGAIQLSGDEHFAVE